MSGARAEFCTDTSTGAPGAANRAPMAVSQTAVPKLFAVIHPPPFQISPTPGVTGLVAHVFTIFHQGVTAASRLMLATNIAKFMKEYNIDGVYTDWEYSGVNERGRLELLPLIFNMPHPGTDHPDIPPGDKYEGKN
ncbi:hypothetical protein EYZ11_011250 [Aspergillus tanneri]|uniref:Chitinase n=1 Tax=Aspergillus tanneri TaxID=1220188 RepID=A0A4V3UN06_9EURO|nr:hypothetical protein EYZ11_011250 [Aspergillus tanneri]